MAAEWGDLEAWRQRARRWHSGSFARAGGAKLAKLAGRGLALNFSCKSGNTKELGRTRPNSQRTKNAVSLAPAKGCGARDGGSFSEARLKGKITISRPLDGTIRILQ